MKKILLIEDRVERQEIFKEETGIDVGLYNILDNQTSINMNELENYSTIITHRSAFGSMDENILDLLKEYCSKNNTKLVFFSGGITSTYYSKTSYEFLLLNSKSFYSQNLKLFLDDAVDNNDENLLLLAYGKNWKINLMLSVLSEVNLYISKNKDKKIKKFTEFTRTTKIDMIKDLIDIEYPPEEAGKVKMSDLGIFAEQVSEKIKQEVRYHA